MSIIDMCATNHVFDFALIVVSGVGLLSGAACLVSRCWPGKPAARHVVLLTALLCCLVVPFLAAAFSASGWTLISVPLLPAGGDRDVVANRATGRSMPIGFVPVASRENRPLPTAPIDLEQRRAEPIPTATNTTDRGSPKKTVPDLRAGVEVAPRHEETRAGRPSVYRSIAALALFVWVCGSVCLLLGLVRSCWGVRQLRRSSSPLADDSLRRLLGDVCRGLGVRRPPSVLASRTATVPFAAGFWRPVVVLPGHMIGAVSRDEMRDVLVHEVAHILRNDHIVVFFQELARALYWPIAPVHGLARELTVAREELCDNHVLKGRDALSYGETLLHMAQLSFEARVPRTSVGILHWKGNLEHRVAGLLDKRRSTMTGSSRSLACLVMLSFVAGGATVSATRFIAAGVDPKSTDQAVPTDKLPQAASRSMLVHVLGPDGRPMPGVEIHRSVWLKEPALAPSIRGASDENGQIRLAVPAGIEIFRIWARADGCVPLFAHWEKEDDPDNSLPAEFTFKLERGTVIGGLIRDENRKPIAGATIEVELKQGGNREGRAGPDMWLSEKGSTTHKGRLPVTDAEGRWTLDNVPSGDDVKVLLNITHPDYISDARWGTLQKEQNIDMPALRTRTATITMRGGVMTQGTVSDPKGNPVVGAVVVRGDQPYWEWGSQEVRTDGKGVYRLPALPKGNMRITVVAEGWMPETRKVELAPGMNPVDFRLRPGKELRVRVVDRAGKPVPEAYAMIDRWNGAESLYNTQHPNVLDTKIPNRSDDAGLFLWTWAPDGAVTYRIGKRGYSEQKVELTADGREQAVTLQSLRRISGKVTDAATGRAISELTAMPVIEFRPGFMSVERHHKERFSGPSYTIEGDRTDGDYRVRVEAPGYRSAMSAAVRPGEADPTFDFRLEPAPPASGRVVDADGRPVAGATVYLATPSQSLTIGQDGDETVSWHEKRQTDGQGMFSFPAQFERYTVIATHALGYTESTFAPEERPGDLSLKAWARVEGRLIQAGQPVPLVWISFEPVHINRLDLPRIQTNYAVETGKDGSFVFERVPPVKARLKAKLSVWHDSPLTSSRSLPLDIRPGERVDVDLGGRGTAVTGRVVLDGVAPDAVDLHKSLNYLLHKRPGIEPPPEVRSLGFNVKNGWNDAWAGTSEGQAYLSTLYYDFITLDKDGRFRVEGLSGGEYEFAIRLYEPPKEGCLVSPIGSRVVKFVVAENAAPGAVIDMGDIKVKATPGPRPGKAVPDFAFTTSSGETLKLSDLRGRYVLLDFWATWCGPCVAELPTIRRIHDTYGDNQRFSVLGLNLDDDTDNARRFVRDRNLPWTQGTLGSRSVDDVLALYAVGAVPAYFLVGPDGKLVYSGSSAAAVEEAVGRALK